MGVYLLKDDGRRAMLPDFMTFFESSSTLRIDAPMDITAVGDYLILLESSLDNSEKSMSATTFVVSIVDDAEANVDDSVEVPVITPQGVERPQ